MPIPVKLNDIIEALESASDSITHYLDTRTGKVEIVTVDDTAAIHLEDDDPSYEPPEWEREAIAIAREIQNDEGERFIKVPDKFDIHEYQIMQEFSRKYPNARISVALQDAIRGSGAFRRFKNLIYEYNLHEDWNEFQRQAYEEIAIDWLEAHEIPYSRGDEIEASGEM